MIIHIVLIIVLVLICVTLSLSLFISLLPTPQLSIPLLEVLQQLAIRPDAVYRDRPVHLICELKLILKELPLLILRISLNNILPEIQSDFSNVRLRVFQQVRLEEGSPICAIVLMIVL